MIVFVFFRAITLNTFTAIVVIEKSLTVIAVDQEPVFYDLKSSCKSAVAIKGLMCAGFEAHANPTHSAGLQSYPQLSRLFK